MNEEENNEDFENEGMFVGGFNSLLLPNNSFLIPLTETRQAVLTHHGTEFHVQLQDETGKLVQDVIVTSSPFSVLSGLCEMLDV